VTTNTTFQELVQHGPQQAREVRAWFSTGHNRRGKSEPGSARATTGEGGQSLVQHGPQQAREVRAWFSTGHNRRGRSEPGGQTTG